MIIESFPSAELHLFDGEEDLAQYLRANPKARDVGRFIRQTPKAGQLVRVIAHYETSRDCQLARESALAAETRAGKDYARSQVSESMRRSGPRNWAKQDAAKKREEEFAAIKYAGL